MLKMQIIAQHGLQVFPKHADCAAQFFVEHIEFSCVVDFHVAANSFEEFADCYLSASANFAAILADQMFAYFTLATFQTSLEDHVRLLIEEVSIVKRLLAFIALLDLRHHVIRVDRRCDFARFSNLCAANFASSAHLVAKRRNKEAFVESFTTLGAQLHHFISNMLFFIFFTH
jgi:hypothetical protein